MKIFLKWLAGVLAVFFLLVVGIFLLISILTDTEPVVHDNTYLHIHLAGTLNEYIPPDPLEEFFGKAALDLKKVRDILEKARVDERIVGVVLEVGYLQCGFAKMKELTNLIKLFRQSGKKIYAYLGGDVNMTRDYYVASACDFVFMPPQSNLILPGILSEVTYYKNFFEKIGVQAEFIHIGKYKSAPDVYTRETMRPAHKEELNELLDEIYADIITTISTQRRLSASEVERLINEQTGFTGKQAQQAGLIDSTLFFTDLPTLFKTEEEPSPISAEDYAQIPPASLKIRNKSRIAVVHCSGTISAGYDSEDYFLGTLAGARSLVSNLQKAARSKLIKAIIFRIDSPGGSAAASEVIWHAVRKARQKKPVIVSISDYGASGGYYVAMEGDSVIAEPTSLVGSIGIFAGKFNIKELYKKLDLNNESLSRGKNARLFSIMQPWTPSEKQLIHRILRSFYDDFVRKVATARRLSLKKAYEIAEGRVWSGKRATKIGLIDSPGHFYDAVKAAKKLANIPEEESVRLVYYPRKKSLLTDFLSAIETRFKMMRDLKLNHIQKLAEYLQHIQNKPLALMPFRLEWR
ncbi:MAG TPA: signal peptide peptidase SppA [Calditrichaeota bacterium]|nr:signal peptide peptidase SppA [Calditrichota bacterium]